MERKSRLALAPVVAPILAVSLAFVPAAFGASNALSVESSARTPTAAQSNPFYADLRTGKAFELEVSDAAFTS